MGGVVHREENQLRADDLLIRGKISEFLGALRKCWNIREQDWRAQRLPPPTRQNPYPDQSAVKTAQSMQAVQKQIEAFEAVIRTAAVPENDRVWQRHRNEAQTLERLMACDNDLLETLVGLLEAAGSTAVTDFSLEPLEKCWGQRQGILF